MVTPTTPVAPSYTQAWWLDPKPSTPISARVLRVIGPKITHWNAGSPSLHPCAVCRRHADHYLAGHGFRVPLWLCNRHFDTLLTRRKARRMRAVFAQIFDTFRGA